jgi:Ca-activated chloride channel homolog
MKYVIITRFAVLFLFLVGTILPGLAQSGRKQQSSKPAPEAAKKTDEATEKEAEAAEEDEEERAASNRPLADNTPVTVSDDGTIKMETSLVTIPASVIGVDGRYIPNLKRRDFRLYEDGVKQYIANFNSVEVPFNVILLLDTSLSTKFRLEYIQAAAKSFVRELRTEDQVMVVSFAGSVNLLSDFTSDREILNNAIDRTQTAGRTKLYEAVELSLSEWMASINGRKAIVLFTDGVDTTSTRATYRSTIKLVEESDVQIYPIRYDTEFDDAQAGATQRNPFPFPLPGRNPTPRTPPSGPGGGAPKWPTPFNQYIRFQFPQWPKGGAPPKHSSSDEYSRGEKYLRELASRSGGRLYNADSLDNLSDAFSRIADELRHQYSLSYYPSNSARDGSWRYVKVRAVKPGLIVRAREGYRAVSAKEKNKNRKKRGYTPGYKDKRKLVAGN